VSAPPGEETAHSPGEALTRELRAGAGTYRLLHDPALSSQEGRVTAEMMM
jgi:hypothetical protein